VEEQKSDISSGVLGLISLFFIVISAIAIVYTPIRGADLGWHLKTGELIWKSGGLLHKDPFSFVTTAQDVWVYQDVLADLLLYGLFQNFGFVGFVLLKLFVLFGFAWFYKARIAKDSFSFTGFLLIVLCVWASLQYRIIQRPLLLSFFFFSLQFCLLEGIRQNPLGERSREFLKSLLPILLVQWLWVQFHRGAVLGYCLLLAYGFVFQLNALLPQKKWTQVLLGNQQKRSFVKYYWSVVGMAVLLGGLNPFGWKVFSTTFSVLGTQMSRPNSSEWESVGLSLFFSHFYFTICLVALAILGWLGSLGWQLRKTGGSESRQATLPVTIWPGLLILVFSLASVKSVRWIPYLSLIAGFSLVCCVNTFEQKLVKRLERWWILTLVGLVMFLGILGQRKAPWKITSDPSFLPIGAIAFAKEKKLSNKVIHPLRFGGYIIWKLWPKAKVLFDGRNDQVYPPGTFDELLNVRYPETFRHYQERYGVDWVLADNRWGHESHLFLSRAKKWAAVYWSDSAVIYVLRSRYPHLAHLSYKWIRMQAVAESVLNWGHRFGSDPLKRMELEAEIKRMAKSSPDSIRVLMAKTIFYHTGGKAFQSQRDKWAKKLRIKGGHLPVVRKFFRWISSI